MASMSHASSSSSSTVSPAVRGLRSRTAHVDRLLDRAGPYTDGSFVPGAAPKNVLATSKLLIIGAGGLGCELLASLALSGFRDIHIIDMDTIDTSNLNRQFLFRAKDVGRPKALVAAEFVTRRVPGVKVTPYHGKIQDKDESYYMRFDIVVCGLDSVEARRWINATLVNMVDPENPDSLKPLIDGGTEGFKGQARVILPTISSCYECSLDMLTRQAVFPICTIANTPRLPEHCIEWASVLEWPRVFGPEKKLDNDDPEHIQWLLDVAQARAKAHSIDGVTWALTQGVVKNIIPAIASTNAVIAAACTQEAFKLATTCAPPLNNYMMYAGSESVYTYTFEHERRPDCPVCGGEARDVSLPRGTPLASILELLADSADVQLKRPSLAGPGGAPLFFQAPKQLREATEGNLVRSLGELLKHEDEITVTDQALPFQLTLRILFTD